ncbi:hypothetical protein VTK73DRAFT_7437 [Phialemonium thermophilum]|uniref:Uncharacterized protein n=1 Tax=Phialemonium thermophilum TaxID=223376 RepID=A0ABR3WEE7_9PEZI
MPTPYCLQFWDVEPPQPPFYYAAQRECQNAALIQMMQAAVARESDDELSPVFLHPSPATLEDAKANLYAFSDDVRRKRKSKGTRGTGMLTVTSVPRMRKCYGWLKIHHDHLWRILPSSLRAGEVQVEKVRRVLQPGLLYTAVVYEFIEPGPNDPEAVQEVLDFLWRAGFEYTQTMSTKNWQSNVLLDHSEIVNPRGDGWRPKRYSRPTALFYEDHFGRHKDSAVLPLPT